MYLLVKNNFNDIKMQGSTKNYKVNVRSKKNCT